MAQDRTGPGFGLNQDPYEVEQREMRAAERCALRDGSCGHRSISDCADYGQKWPSWAAEQAATRRRSGIDGPGGYNCFGQFNHIHATERDAEGCQAEQAEQEAVSW